MEGFTKGEGSILKSRTCHFVLAIAIVLAIAGCGKKQAAESSSEPAPTATVDPTTAGSISGTVALKGPPPVFRPIDMSGEAVCAQANPEPVIPPIVVTGDHGALSNVVVYVKSGLGRYRFDTPKQPVYLEQKRCMFEPRVVALMTNQTLVIANEDHTVHNVHALPRENRSWNRSQQPGEAPFETSFTHPELAIPIMCNVHPWMRAIAFVFAHPYFAITPKTGTFELKNLPPGTYTIEAWHEKFGMQDQTVTLGAKESKSISFTFTSAPSP
jgi:plastocyanin